MIDYCCNQFFGIPFDKDGKIASEGKVCDSWLNLLCEDEYYYKNPPKTTGREYFSKKYIENALKYAPEDERDIITTLTALSAKTITDSYKRFVYDHTPIDEVVICGGG